MNVSVLKLVQQLSGLLPCLQEKKADFERSQEEFLSVVHKLLAQSRDIGLPMPSENYYSVIENGLKRFVNAKEVEKIRQKWQGNFLLDIPYRVLRIRKCGKSVKLPLGEGGLHWGLEKVLTLGMSRPGIPFGYKSFKLNNSSPAALFARTLTRYVFEVRKFLGDTNKIKQCLKKASVDISQSDSGRGYVFLKKWTYIVING
jgi:hypothetical protein